MPSFTVVPALRIEGGNQVSASAKVSFAHKDNTITVSTLMTGQLRARASSCPPRPPPTPHRAGPCAGLRGRQPVPERRGRGGLQRPPGGPLRCGESQFPACPPREGPRSGAEGASSTLLLQSNHAPRVRLNTHLNVRDRRVNLTYRRDIKGNSECRDLALLRHQTLSSDTCSDTSPVTTAPVSCCPRSLLPGGLPGSRRQQHRWRGLRPQVRLGPELGGLPSWPSPMVTESSSRSSWHSTCALLPSIQNTQK